MPDPQDSSLDLGQMDNTASSISQKDMAQTYIRVNDFVNAHGGKDKVKKVMDSTTGKPMDVNKLAAIIQSAELGNKRLDVLTQKIDSLPVDKGLSANDSKTLIRILKDVRSSRPNEAEKQQIDRIVSAVEKRGDKGLTATETHGVLDQLDQIRHDHTFFKPETVKSIEQGLQQKIQELNAAGKDCPQHERLLAITQAIAQLNDIKEEIKPSESTGMSEKEASNVLAELKAIGSKSDDTKDDKKDKKDDDQSEREESESSETEEVGDEASEGLESMGEEGGESVLEDGVADGLGDAAVDGVADVAVDGVADVAVDAAADVAVDAVGSTIVEGAGGLIGAEGAALPEEAGAVLGAAGGVELAALPEEAIAAEAVVGVGAAAL